MLEFTEILRTDSKCFWNLHQLTLVSTRAVKSRIQVERMRFAENDRIIDRCCRISTKFNADRRKARLC